MRKLTVIILFVVLPSLANGKIKLPDFAKWPVTGWDVLNCLYRGQEMFTADWHYEKSTDTKREYIGLFFAPFLPTIDGPDLSSGPKHEKVEKWVLGLQKDKAIFLIYMVEKKGSSGYSEQVFLYEKNRRRFWPFLGSKWRLVKRLDDLSPAETGKFFEERYGLIFN